jgi:hypothetical protein
LDTYFQNAKPNQVVAVLTAREPARILVAIGDKDNDSPHLEYKQRWVNQFNFYLNDARWGRMFVRMCPYFPFSARVCLNQHDWLAARMREEGMDFQQSTNGFLKCGNPARLQELADSLTARDLLQCGQKWLAAFTPFITDKERRQAGCQHRLFFAQVEYCDNLIFHRRAAVEELTQRLLDLNRNIGQPKKITTIFGRKVTKQYKGKLQPVIEDLDLPNPVIRSHYGHGFAKQYVRDDQLLRTEPATNNVYDYGVNKDVENLPQLRDRMSEIIDNYHNSQQDALETFIDRGQLRKLAEPTILSNGRRIPGLKLDHPRQLAVMHSLVRFANIAAGRQVHHRRPLRPGTRCPGQDRGRIFTGVVSLRPVKAPRQGIGRANSAVASLPAGWQRLLRLRDLPQTVRENLRAPYRRSAQALPQRSPVGGREALRTRPLVSTRLR